ncbi:MAG: hypothetical protein ACRCTD_14960 [Beijerinckiaceae bacterium]
MKTNTQVRLLASMLAQSVFFGIGAIVVLSVPALSVHAAYSIPAVVIAAILLGGIAGWILGPKMRARYWRKPAPE